MKKTLYFIFILFTNTQISAQEKNIISGVILDQLTRTPVEGATIQLSKTSNYSITSDEGRYLIKKTTEADSVKVSAIGYKELLISLGDFTKNDVILLEKENVLLEEIVVAGHTNPMNIISKLDVKLKGINNAQEALRIIPGLFIGQHAGGGKAEQIFLRGFDIDHGTDINIGVDGIPVNMVSHAHGQGYADLHFVIPELLQDVQFRKGTYDATKGNFTTAGYVDFRTKKELEKNTIKLEAGQYSTFRNVVMLNLLNKQNTTKSWYATGEYLYSKGYFDHPQNLNRFNFFTKYSSTLSNNHDLVITASTFKSSWKASGQIPDRSVNAGDISFFGAIDPNEGGNTSRANLNFQLTSKFKNHAVLKNQLYFTNYNFDLFSNFTFFLNDPVNGDQIRQKEKRNLFGYNANYSTESFIKSRQLTSNLGLNVRIDDVNDIELSRTKNRQTTLQKLQSGNIDELNIGFYANETLKWNSLITINAGVRYDVFNFKYHDQLNSNKLQSMSSIISPKLNILIHPNDKTEIYASVGKGFHSNDTRVVLNQYKKSLPPAYGSDLGINYKFSKKLFLNVAAWYLFLDQEFVYVGDEGIVEPSGKTVRKGLDFAFRYQPFKYLFVDADFNYAYARAKGEEKGNDYLPLAPKFTSSGGINFKSESGFTVSSRYRYMSDRPAIEDNSIIAKGYFIADASAGYSTKKFEILFTAQNIFNTRWKETQFATESRLKNELEPVNEIHFTPGTPLFVKLSLSYFF